MFADWIHGVLKEVGHELESPARDQSIWSLSSAVPRLAVVECLDMALSLRASLPGHAASGLLSIALTAGEARVGVVLPKSAVAHGVQDLSAPMSLAFNGSPPAIKRTMPGGQVLLDWHFHDDPFSARFLCDAARDDILRASVVHALSFAAMTIWRGVIEVMATLGRFDLAHDLMAITDQELPRASLIQRVPCLIYDQMYEAQSRQWYTVLRSEMDQDEMTRSLRELGVNGHVRPMIRAQEAVD